MSFQDLKSLLPKAMAKYNMTREARAAQVCSAFRELLPRIVGEEAGEKVSPKFFRNGILYVSVPSSGWAQRVIIHRHELLTALRVRAEEVNVKDIRTQVG